MEMQSFAVSLRLLLPYTNTNNTALHLGYKSWYKILGDHYIILMYHNTIFKIG